MNFRGEVLLSGKSATGIQVPDEIIEALGGGRRPALHVTLKGYSYRTTVGVMGGRCMIPLSAEHRNAAGVAAGEQVDVEVTLDTAPRAVEVPADLAAVLAADPGAKAAFEALSPSRKKAMVLSVTDAKTPETRARRVEKARADLRPA